MRLQGSPSWPRKSDRQSLSPSRAYCERLICVYDDHAERGWWHDLEHGEELLFADGGRIVETSLEELGAGIEEAVEQGYRPVVLIDGMRNWAPAMEAFGRHQAFGSVYAMGRDDAQMSDLLHNPSQEILSVAHDGGRIVVPMFEYGKALDGYLKAGLEDFDLTEFNNEDPLEPTLKLVCRLNPFRYMDVKLYCKNGVVRLTQKYRIVDDSKESDEPCDRPVQFQEWLLDFKESNPVSTAEIAGGRSTFMKAFTETFELPQAYQGWEPGKEPPWEILKNQLNQMSRGAMAYLSTAQQGLLSLLDKDVVAHALESFGQSLSGARPAPVPVRGVPYGDRNGPKASGSETAFVILRRAAEEQSDELAFEVAWLFHDRPMKQPKVVVDESSRPAELPPISYEWSGDLASLKLSGVGMRDGKIGWVWSAEKNVLKISLIDSTSSENA